MWIHPKPDDLIANLKSEKYFGNGKPLKNNKKCSK